MDDLATSSCEALVIGAGPAGLMAAIYLLRFHREVRVYGSAASRAVRIPRSHNFPGFPGGIPGEELLHRLRQQLAELGGRVEELRVSRLDRTAGGEFVAQVGAQAIRASAVVLATGVEDVLPAVEGVEALLAERRARFCPICDGHESAGRRVAVLGLGAHGWREAEFIRHYASEVTLVQLPQAQVAGGVPPGVGEGGAEAAQADAASPGITVWSGMCRRLALASVERGAQWRASGLPGAGGPVLIEMENGRAGEFDVVYVALGVRARSELAQALGAELDARGGVQIDDHARTSVPGVYAVGDVASALDQIVVGMAHAALAATDIHNRLRRRDGKDCSLACAGSGNLAAPRR